jgi:hypothetical protein
VSAASLSNQPAPVRTPRYTLGSLKRGGHPLKWATQKLESLPWSVATGKVWLWFWVTAYYLLTQNAWVKPHWDTLGDPLFGHRLWKFIEHQARNGGESEYATLGVLLLLASPLKRKTGPSLALKLRFKLHLLEPGVPLAEYYARHYDESGLKIETPLLASTALKLRVFPSRYQYRETGHRTTGLQYVLLVLTVMAASVPGYAVADLVTWVVETFMQAHHRT